MAISFSLQRFVLGGLLLATLARAAGAAPTTYVHPSAPSCGGPSPCYSTIDAAVQNVDTNGTVIVLANVSSSIFQTFGKTGITVRGNTSAVTVDAVVVPGAAMTGWTIRDLTFTNVINIQNVAASLTIDNLTLNGPGIQLGPLTQPNTNALITINNVRFPTPGQPNSFIAILGATGADIGGSVTVTNCVNAYSVTVRSRASAGDPAPITANITVSNNQLFLGAGVNIESDGSGGSGDITGNIQMLNNATSPTQGSVGVLLVGGVLGNITGPMTFSGNTVQRLVVNTIDGGGPIGSLLVSNNDLEVVEIVARGGALYGPVTVAGNSIVDHGSGLQMPTLQVDGDPVTGEINIDNNTGTAYVSTVSFVGGYSGPLRIRNNACRRIVVDSQGGALGQPFTISNNSLGPAANPESILNVRTLAGGNIAGGTLSGNLLDGILFDIAGSLAGNLAVSFNTTRELASFNAIGAIGPGTITLTGNNFIGHTALRSMTAVARFNRIFGTASFSGTALVDARYNWWGCNGGPGAPGCTIGTGSAAVYPSLTFSAKSRCTSATSVAQTVDLLTANDFSAPAGNVTPGAALVTSTQGTVSPSTLFFAGSGTATVTLPGAATPTITSQLDSASISWPARCDPDATAVALFAQGTFQLRNRNTSGPADALFGYGAGSWIRLMGDWDGDGVDSPGAYDPAASAFYLRNSNSSGFANVAFTYGYGGSGWLPLAGDWNGDGIDTVGLYDPVSSAFYLRNSNDSGFADLTFYYGRGGAGWRPVVGDWNGDGTDTIGLYDPAATFYLRNSNSTGIADVTFNYGPVSSGWRPLAGDWNGDGIVTIGLYAPSTSTFYLRNSNSTGIADVTFTFGAAGAGNVPLAGDFDGPL